MFYLQGVDPIIGNYENALYPENVSLEEAICSAPSQRMSVMGRISKAS